MKIMSMAFESTVDSLVYNWRQKYYNILTMSCRVRSIDKVIAKCSCYRIRQICDRLHTLHWMVKYNTIKSNTLLMETNQINLRIQKNNLRQCKSIHDISWYVHFRCFCNIMKIITLCFWMLNIWRTLGQISMIQCNVLTFV